MIAKYHVDYALNFGGHLYHAQDYHTDDPVACEEFLVSLLEHGMKVVSIRHEGVALPAPEFDRMIKSAANTMAAKHISQSLGLNAEQVHFRFGYAA